MSQLENQMSKIAENYCEKFPNGSATRDLLSGFNGGSFCEALREGDIDSMVYRADGNNSLILYLLLNECIQGFMPQNLTKEQYQTLRSKAFWKAGERS
jgi:hypothetical protein